MNTSALLTGYQANVQSMTRHEAIAAAIKAAIDSGELARGARLPTVRALSIDLNVSASTVVAAYARLRSSGHIAGEVGRGTYILPNTASPTADNDSAELPGWTTSSTQTRPPWRRRTILTSANRLLSLHPEALDCTRGKPDSTLILTKIVQRAQRRAAEDTSTDNLQYAGPAALPQLRELLEPRLIADGIPVEGVDMIAGTSAQQLMVMSLSIAARLMPDRPKIVAVEEPGYQTVFDAFEYLGFRLIGMRLDDQGVLPEALEAALEGGAIAALFTPRALNPRGVSWTQERRKAIADVLQAYPHAIAIEDDQFADLALSHPGSLLEGPITHRAVYVRTFAKSIAPDMRIAVALARPRLANMLGEAKSLLDGWTSLMSQRTLAYTLEDPAFEVELGRAQQAYRTRRETIIKLLGERLYSTGTKLSGADGLNIWIRLPFGVAATDVVDNAAQAGVLLVSGEPFYIRPGHNDVIRMSISGIESHQAETAAHLVADAILASSTRAPISIPV